MPLVPPLQQPLGQLTTLHRHRPFDVSHAPFAHGEHAAPPAPHSDAD